MKQYSANILVIDDNKLDKAYSEEVLKEFGCTVETSDGLEAVEKLEDSYDMILIDINMPGVDGFTLSSAFKKATPIDSQRFVFLISGDSPSAFIAEKCRQSKINGFFSKPINTDMLQKVFSEYLSDKEIQGGQDQGFFFLNKPVACG